MQKDRILYKLEEDEIPALVDFIKRQGFVFHPRPEDSAQCFSRKSNRKGKDIGYIEAHTECEEAREGYLMRLNIPVGGPIEQMIEAYRTGRVLKLVRYADLARGYVGSGDNTQK